MKKLIWWITLIGIVGAQAFAFVCASRWMDNLFLKLNGFWEAVQIAPETWGNVRIGDKDAMLYVKSLQVDAAIVTTSMRVAAIASTALLVFFTVTILLAKRRKRQKADTTSA